MTSPEFRQLVKDLGVKYIRAREVARSNGWILKDVKGNEVTRTGNEVMKIADIGNPEYVSWLANRIKSETDDPNVAGTFADVTQVRVHRVNSWPINPRKDNPTPTRNGAGIWQP
jgi:alpha-glucosidase (family GH31 glycosyl hydrolase)